MLAVVADRCRHAPVVELTDTREARMMRVPWVTSPTSSYRGTVCCEEGAHLVRVDVADGVCARPHDIALGTAPVAGSRALAYSPRRVGWRAGRAFPASIAGSRGSRALLVELLLVPQQQVASREASRAFTALKGLLFCVGSLVALQMLQSRECPRARRADMRPGLVVLGFGEGRDGGVRCPRLCSLH
jgi:hypothetical protein